MIERLKTVKQSLADRPQIRRAFFVVIVLAVLGLAGRVVYHRMTHIDVTDARIASEMISLASRSPGWLTARPVKEGDIVHRDQVLAEIYAQNASLAASAQEAGLQSAQAEVMRLDQLMLETRASTLATVQEAKSQLAAVQVAIEQARLNEAKTQADYLRDRDLVDRQFVSEQRVQQSETVYKIAQGERERLDL